MAMALATWVEPQGLVVFRHNPAKDSAKVVEDQVLQLLEVTVHQTKDQNPFVVAAERAAVAVESIQHLWLGMDSEVEGLLHCPCGQSVWPLLR